MSEILNVHTCFPAVEKYLEEVKNQIMQNGTGASALPTGAHVRDDEQVDTTVVYYNDFYYRMNNTITNEYFPFHK